MRIFPMISALGIWVCFACGGAAALDRVGKDSTPSSRSSASFLLSSSYPPAPSLSSDPEPRPIVLPRSILNSKKRESRKPKDDGRPTLLQRLYQYLREDSTNDYFGAPESELEVEESEDSVPFQYDGYGASPDSQTAQERLDRAQSSSAETDQEFSEAAFEEDLADGILAGFPQILVQEDNPNHMLLTNTLGHVLTHISVITDQQRDLLFQDEDIKLLFQGKLPDVPTSDS